MQPAVQVATGSCTSVHTGQTPLQECMATENHRSSITLALGTCTTAVHVSREATFAAQPLLTMAMRTPHVLVVVRVLKGAVGGGAALAIREVDGEDLQQLLQVSGADVVEGVDLAVDGYSSFVLVIA